MAKSPDGQAHHGVLLLDKPVGLSSNVALQRVRRLFAWSKAGHTGTLDPLATGLLPICLGEATKFSHALLDADKSYEATICLGFTSSTGDAEGDIEQHGVAEFTDTELQQVLASFVGPIEQTPPMHSALKKDGKPLYAYARAGETVVREPRKIIIKTLQLIERKQNILRIFVECSKGTYIRVLAEDIGKALGCGGYLQALRRTGIRDLRVEDALGLDQLNAMDETSRLASLLPVDRLVDVLPVLNLPEEASRRVVNGLPIPTGSATAGLVRLYDATGAFLGIGENRPDGTLVPKRLVSNPPATKTPVVDAQLSP